MPARNKGRDYSLIGREAKRAEERRLTSAQWYGAPVPRKRLKELMQRRDGPALRDTLLWFVLLIITGGIGYFTWGTWWCVPAFMAYGVLYGSALWTHSLLPIVYIGLPTFYGAWLMALFGLTQHAGLAEDVLDHRLNCRTVYMNPIFRFIYWNMGYHIEHHMFPVVPYHALPALHEEMKEDAPPPYRGLWEAYKEIIPTLLKQVKDPGYFICRQLPPKATPFPVPMPATEPV